MSYDKAEQLARDVLDGLLATIDRLTARVVELERDRAETSKESNRLAARVEEYADAIATGARNLGLVTMERDRLRARVEWLRGLLREACDLTRGALNQIDTNDEGVMSNVYAAERRLAAIARELEQKP